jgi:ABC-type transport system substrate-binding protein
MFHSKSRANFSRYKNPEMDKLLVAQRMETDPEKRKQLLCKIVRLINQDVPIIYRGGRRHSMITTQNVKGIKQITYGIVPLADAWIE